MPSGMRRKRFRPREAFRQGDVALGGRQDDGRGAEPRGQLLAPEHRQTEGERAPFREAPAVRGIDDARTRAREARREARPTIPALLLLACTKIETLLIDQVPQSADGLEVAPRRDRTDQVRELEGLHAGGKAPEEFARLRRSGGHGHVEISRRGGGQADDIALGPPQAEEVTSSKSFGRGCAMGLRLKSAVGTLYHAWKVVFATGIFPPDIGGPPRPCRCCPMRGPPGASGRRGDVFRRRGRWASHAPMT